MLAQMLPLDLREYYALNTLLDVLFVRHGAVPDDWQALRHYMPRLNSRGWDTVRAKLIQLGHIRIEDGSIRSEVVNRRMSDLKRQRDANAMGGHIAQAKQKMRMFSSSSEPRQRPNFSEPSAQAIEMVRAGVESTSSIQTPDHRDKEEKEEKEVRAAPPPSSSFGNDAVLVAAKGLSEVVRDVEIKASPYLAQQIKSRCA
jgi:hypothetical protein